MARDTLSRSMHDLGLAAWFGGTLANAVALNAAAGEASDSRDTGAVANKGWDRWTPVNAGAIGLHLVGGIGQLIGTPRAASTAQQGVPTMAGTKTALTAAALGATAYSRVLGRTVSEHDDVPAESCTTSLNWTPPHVAQGGVADVTVAGFAELDGELAGHRRRRRHRPPRDRAGAPGCCPRLARPLGPRGGSASWATRGTRADVARRSPRSGVPPTRRSRARSAPADPAWTSGRGKPAEIAVHAAPSLLADRNGRAGGFAHGG